jgi:hypothetical protein
MQQGKINKEAMFAHMQAWQQSGISQKKYCFDQNIPYHLFHYWYRKYREEQTVSAGSFIQLSSPVSSQIPFAEFTFPSGGRILFHQPVSIEYLKALAG